MTKHEELTKMIAHLEHMQEKGFAKATVSSSLNIVLALRIPMQNCAMSASSGKVVCTAGTEFLLTHLRREKSLLEH